MTLDEAARYYGSKAELARALRISKGAISQWNGVIPEPRQLQLHKLTRGALKADAPILAKYREILRAA
jgi:transcriptional repressor of cell division inhibition gene dicB